MPVTKPPALAYAALPARVDAAHFAAPQCHNCGAAIASPCCPQCGQPRARRIGSGLFGRELWNKWKPLDADVVLAAGRLLRRPGRVAREFVLGARKRHVHPIKLLLVGIGFLVLIVQRGNYLASAHTPVSHAMAMVQTWANLSFSLGVAAIVLATWLFFRGRGGYNVFEHLVLACYAQFVVIVVSVLSKLPTLLWTDAGFLATHRLASGWLLAATGALVFFAACAQFFSLDLRRDAPRLLAATAFFLGVRWLLMRAYALVLVRIALAGA